MEFGNFPPLIGSYVQFVGINSVDDFAGALVGSHSHEMAVSVMVLIVVLMAQQFGYSMRKGSARTLAAIGLSLVAIGTVVMTVMYVAAAFTTWSPPAWFVSGPGGANGIASDDVITGILVMGGGLLVAAALVLERSSIRMPVRLAAAWSWLLSFATVVVAGFAIEMNEVYFLLPVVAVVLMLAQQKMLSSPGSTRILACSCSPLSCWSCWSSSAW